MKASSLILLAGSAVGFTPCNLVDWKCISTSSFCLADLARECAAGTFCSEPFHNLHPNESPCITAPNSYGCDKTTWTCKISTGAQNMTSCEEGCVAPVPTPAPPPPTPPPAPMDCNGAKDYTCYSAAGFCLAGTKKACWVDSYCSPVFHAWDPTQSPCILPLQGWGCNPTTKQCDYEIGRFNKTECESLCK